MDNLRHDGVHGRIIYWILYKVHNETWLRVHPEDNNELFLKEDDEIIKGLDSEF